MAFPNVTDIIFSAQDSRFIKDPFFAGSSITLNNDGKPYMFAGGFSQVFQILKGETKWAFKVWKHDFHEQEGRYRIIQGYLDRVRLPYFLDFEYVSKGLLVNGMQIPSLRMPWMDGALLKYYINQHIGNASIISNLADSFLLMTKDLHENSISHGDLKNDNIFVTTDGAIKLIDYDAICVPDLEGWNEICRGTEGYQHPLRDIFGESTSTKVDHFSELVIFLSIKAISENPILWEKYSVMNADYRLLFTKNDFWNFKHSEIRRDLMGLSQEIQLLVARLDSYLAAYLYLPPIAI